METPTTERAGAAGVAALAIGAAAVLGVVLAGLPEATGGRFGGLLLALGGAAAAFAAARVRGLPVRPAAVGLALVVAAVLGRAAAELPAWSAAEFAGQGPADALVLLAAGAALLGLAAFARSLSVRELALLVLAVLSAANGKVFTRSNELFFPLLGCVAAIALAAEPRAPVPPVRGRAAGALAVRGRAAGALAVAAALFCAWTAYSGLAGENPGRTDEVFGRMLIGVVGGVLAARALGPRGAERLVTAAALAGAAGWMAVPVLLELVRVQEPAQLLAGTRLRLFGLHPNLTGSFLAVQFALALALLPGQRGGRRGGLRIALVVAAAGCLPGLVLAKSRTAWIAAAAGVGALLLFRRLSRRAWTALFAAALAAFAAVLLVAPLRELVLRQETSGSSFAQRLYLWDAAARLVAESPLRGIGPNNYFAHARAGATPSYFDNTDKTLHTHNLLLAVAEGSGLVGLALFLAVVVLAFALALRAAAPESPAPRAGRAALAGLAALFAANMLDLGLSQVTFVPTLFWLLAGAAAAVVDGGAAGPATSAPPSRALRGAALAAALGFVALFCARPFAAELYLRRGIRLEELEEPGPALAAWSAAARLAPLDTAPLVRAAKVAAESGRAERARQLYARAAELAPTHPRIRYRNANFAVSQGRAQEALAEARAALALDPAGPDEAVLRALLAELEGLAGNAAAVRAELRELVLAADKLPDRFAPRFAVPVRGGAPVPIADVAREVARDNVADAGSRETWDNRRRGDRTARVLAQLGAPDEAERMLEGMQAAMGSPDPSLARLQAELAAARGGEAEAAALERSVLAAQGAHVQKAGMGLGDGTPEELAQEALANLRAPFDAFFDASAFRLFARRLLDARLAAGRLDEARDALELLMFYSESEERATARAEVAEALAQRGRGPAALALVADGVREADFLAHSATRAQVVFRLVSAGLVAVPEGGPRERLARLERALEGGGAAARLARILLRLNLAGADAQLLDEARARYAALRERFPAEGIAVGRFLEGR